MALIICPECKSQISEHADACPHCGFPIKQPNRNIPLNQNISHNVNVDKGNCPRCGGQMFLRKSIWGKVFGEQKDINV